jgi:hypothetical protein
MNHSNKATAALINIRARILRAGKIKDSYGRGCELATDAAKIRVNVRYFIKANVARANRHLYIAIGCWTFRAAFTNRLICPQ